MPAARLSATCFWSSANLYGGIAPRRLAGSVRAIGQVRLSTAHGAPDRTKQSVPKWYDGVPGSAVARPGGRSLDSHRDVGQIAHPLRDAVAVEAVRAEDLVVLAALGYLVYSDLVQPGRRPGRIRGERRENCVPKTAGKVVVVEGDDRRVVGDVGHP